MKTEFRRAAKPAELRSLQIFDRKAFHRYPADWFGPDAWEDFDAWWMLIDNRKIGCCAFESHVDFQEDIRRDRHNPHRPASLYIASTAILPDFQGQGCGDLLKCWQITYARHRGFNHIVTNTRKSNQAMIRLNRKYGFKVIRTTPNYYESPRESTIVMARDL